MEKKRREERRKIIKIENVKERKENKTEMVLKKIRKERKKDGTRKIEARQKMLKGSKYNETEEDEIR